MQQETPLEGDAAESDPFGDLTCWFSFVKEDQGGGVSRVYHTEDESQVALAFKKSLSRLFAIGGAVERGVGPDGTHVVSERTSSVGDQGTVVTEKVSFIKSHDNCIASQ